MKLLIRNLNRKTTEVKLKKIFMPFGIVSSCILITDSKTGNSKGFGFVEMAANIDGNKAIKALDNSMLEGKKIRVKSAEEETSTKL